MRACAAAWGARLGQRPRAYRARRKAPAGGALSPASADAGPTGCRIRGTRMLSSLTASQGPEGSVFSLVIPRSHRTGSSRRDQWQQGTSSVGTSRGENCRAGGGARSRCGPGDPETPRPWTGLRLCRVLKGRLRPTAVRVPGGATGTRPGALQSNAHPGSLP